jgi:hypothetical protein
MKTKKPPELRNCPKCAAVLDGLRVCKVCGYKLRGPKPKVDGMLFVKAATPESTIPQPVLDLQPLPLTLTLTLNLLVTPDQLEDLLKKVANLHIVGELT